MHCSLPLLVWSMIKIEEEDEDTIGAVVFLRLELKLLWLKFSRLNTLELPELYLGVGVSQSHQVKGQLVRLF